MWIMTENGWREIVCPSCEPRAPEVPFKNPFRCFEKGGHKTFRDWIASSG
jgi:hypothetical protein